MLARFFPLVLVFAVGGVGSTAFALTRTALKEGAAAQPTASAPPARAGKPIRRGGMTTLGDVGQRNKRGELIRNSVQVDLETGTVHAQPGEAIQPVRLNLHLDDRTYRFGESAERGQVVARGVAVIQRTDGSHFEQVLTVRLDPIQHAPSDHLGHRAPSSYQGSLEFELRADEVNSLGEIAEIRIGFHGNGDADRDTNADHLYTVYRR
jgi:hypothetical protein